MNFLNSQQLAFILDIKKEDARAKMCNAWEKEKGIQRTDHHKVEVKGAEWEKKKVKDSYPLAMPVEMLSRQLNLPDLQTAVKDITQNFLTRKATKKWILYDYVEKKINSARNEGKQFPITIDLPPALKSLLPPETVREIYNSWLGTFKDAQYKPIVCVK